MIGIPVKKKKEKMIKMKKKKSFYNCIDHDKYITNAIRNRNINAVESDTFIYFSYRFQVKTYKKLGLTWRRDKRWSLTDRRREEWRRGDVWRQWPRRKERWRHLSHGGFSVRGGMFRDHLRVLKSHDSVPRYVDLQHGD